MINLLYFCSKEYKAECDYRDYIRDNVIPNIKLCGDAEGIDIKVSRLKQGC